MRSEYDIIDDFCGKMQEITKRELKRTNEKLAHSIASKKESTELRKLCLELEKLLEAKIIQEVESCTG